MSSFDKTVKLACKPKAAPPKAKYLDPIIAATYSEDGAVDDVCKALSPRLREPNNIVVFKALIVLHTMIRNGATDNVLAYLSSSDVLRLRNVTVGDWEGYKAPENLTNYALYLDSRIRIYKDLKHDPVRVQSDSNRDFRTEMSLGGANGGASARDKQRTQAARMLRSMTVDKGLLRETKAVQKTMSVLLDCKFYLDDLEDELIVTALRMLVKDLLILFQALNEGIVNILEQYFEMSHIDAEQSLAIYRHFCKQTDRVVEYMGIARKLQNLLNVPIPNLNHAPVSLTGALEEYLKDPNFEQNRIEYKLAKAQADKSIKEGSKRASTSGNKPQETKPSTSNGAAESSKAASGSGAATTSATATNTDSKTKAEQALQDFFTSIEPEQPAPMNNNPQMAFFQPQPTGAVHNPFVQRQSMMMTGAFPNGMMQMTSPVPPMPTGFPQIQAQPQIGNAFAGQPPMPSSLPMASSSSHPSFNSFLQPQPQMQVQPTGFLQPQTTGANPFRQSMMLPQTTGMSPFGMGMGTSNVGAGGIGAWPGAGASASTGTSPFSSASPQASFSPPTNGIAQPGGVPATSGSTPANAFNAPPRPASTPATSRASVAFGHNTQPLVSHQTGSRNPFGIPQAAPPPPMPKPPTLFDLANGLGSANASTNSSAGTAAGQQQQGQQDSSLRGLSNFGLGLGAGGTSVGPKKAQDTPSTGSISGVASSFVFNPNPSTSTNGTSSLGSPTTSTAPSLFSQPTSTSTFSSQTTGTGLFSSGLSGAPGSPPSMPSSFGLSSLQPQTTGFSGLKPFKPTSSFGASLLETLPPIPEPTTLSTTSTTSATTSGLPTTGTTTSTLSGLPSFSTTSATSSATLSTGLGTGALNAQPTGLGGLGSFGGLGSGLGSGLRPQPTGGAGVANPFRASMINPSLTGFPGAPSFNLGSSAGTGLGGANFGTSTGVGSNPSLGFGGASFLSGSVGVGGQPNAAAADASKHSGVASLI